MVKFEGIYKRTKSENYDEFLSKLGLNFMIRKAATLSSPVLHISKTPEGKWNFRTETKMKTTNLEFSLGEDWIETMPDDRKVSCHAVLEGNKIIITQSPMDAEGKKVVVVREFTQDGIAVQMTIDDVMCKQFFERQ